MDTIIENAYSQEGGNLPFFVGKQHGSGWLRTLARFAFPLLKGAAKVVGNTAQDVIYDKKKLLPALQENAVEAATKAITSINTPSYKRKRQHKFFQKKKNAKRVRR